VAELPGFIEKPAAAPQTYRDLLFDRLAQQIPCAAKSTSEVSAFVAAAQGMTVLESLLAPFRRLHSQRKCHELRLL
jgi:hypothetical protein